MIGRLVQQQQPGLADEHLGQCDAHLPATGEVLGTLVAVGAVEAQTSQDLGDFSFHCVAAQLIEPLQELALPIDQRLEQIVGACRRRVGDLGFEPGQLNLGLLQLGKAREHLVPQAAPAVHACVLGQIGDLGRLVQLTLQTNRALVGLEYARHDLEQARLARTIGADQRHLGPVGDLERNIREYVVAAKRFLEIQYAQHEQGSLRELEEGGQLTPSAQMAHPQVGQVILSIARS